MKPGSRKLSEEPYRYQMILEETLTKLLGHFVSICCVCRKVRIPVKQTGGKETWLPLESYIPHHSGIVFSHGYCPECEAEFYREIDDRSKQLHSHLIPPAIMSRENHKRESDL